MSNTYNIQNLKDDILSTIDVYGDGLGSSDTKIEAILLGPSRFAEGMIRGDYKNKILSWQDACKILDDNYHGNFDWLDKHPMYVWTKGYILVITIYENVPFINIISRNY